MWIGIRYLIRSSNSCFFCSLCTWCAIPGVMASVAVSTDSRTRTTDVYSQTQECNGSSEWPQVICCETMGHCDKIDGEGSEDACLQMLQHDFGYNVLMAGGSNTVLVKGSVLDQPLRLQRWIAKHMYCHYCRSTCWPFSLIKGGKLHCLSAACISKGMTC